jgi:hypothetical protein
MVRGAAINVTSLTIFGVFSVTLFLSEVPSISPSLY